MAAEKAFRVGIVQGIAIPGEIEANLATLRRLVMQAVEQGAQVVVTPELFATGYDPATAWQWDGASIRQQLAELARDLGVALVASTVDSTVDCAADSGAGGGSGEGAAVVPVTDLASDDGGSSKEACHRIAASFFTPEGHELARVHKRHLFGPVEQEFMTPGAGYAEPFDWGGWRWGMGICYDVEFPEFSRFQAVRGAQALLVPTAVPELESGMPGRAAAWSYSATLTSTLQVPARALENGVYVAYANHCAEGFTGHSCIATPFGKNAVLLDRAEDVAVIELDAEALGVARTLNTYVGDLGRG
ncbi:nitrilase-related carbon-nitrogen hydrolase [Pseudarthrobacter sp. PS3-L1]|uniref:nitrilase-related carbon-nitrogen hydrolase n=1 Tax=Pseudarthrobacter sp. PS3-L1 TaxID=3046207 RepID=UPI0024B90659|nr:nitrilase-related carbon-nitrogen hydrolase [Pseudarthrobacter sp. PS3-L1]MDJ0319522.1 nitrilase-related carbon-nitrogen hydrolase [Pseudarthrobacter sp. PS3-L1]